MSGKRDLAIAEVSQLLAQKVGLRLDSAHRGRLTHAVQQEAELRLLDVETYVAALGSDADALQSLLDRVTVQETAFFRDPTQFDALAKHVFPTLAEPVTIWSAGCANGQEPYSIAMVLDELGMRDATVCATDISTKALSRTREARYSTREIVGLSSTRRAQYLSVVGNRFEITPELRARVDVQYLNLVTDPPPLTPELCPVVLCRNVLIYFNDEEVARVLDRIADWMPPGGWLFLGYSESLWQVTERFELVRVGDAFVYRRNDRDPISPAVPERTRNRAMGKRVPHRREPTSRLARPVEVAAANAATSPSDVGDLLIAGEAALESGDHETAVATFRKCVYLDADQPVAHLHLGLALEAAGDAPAARRAYAAARATLDACDPVAVKAVLEGYQVEDLVRLLDRKLMEVR